MLGLWPWDGATTRNRRFTEFMRDHDHLLQARHISPEANNLIRDILHFHPELRLSVPEISARVLQLHSFFYDPCVESTAAELQGMERTYRRMLTREDPIALRRKELEYLGGLDEISAFNKLTARLPLPGSLPGIIHVSPSLENPPPQTYMPYCTPISNVPPPVTIGAPEGPDRSNKWWHLESLKPASGWYYP